MNLLYGFDDPEYGPLHSEHILEPSEFNSECAIREVVVPEITFTIDQLREMLKIRD